MQHHNAEERKMRHLFKKLIVWTLCLAMAVGMLPGLARGAKAAEPDAGASTGIAWNNEKGYYEISSYAGLLAFADIVNNKGETGANAILTGDIDASASKTDSAWTPIGTNLRPYAGAFDGQKFKIEGLTTIDTDAFYVGLFGYVGEDGRVQNVALESGSIKGNSYVGGVAGYNSGTVLNCYNTGKVEGSGDSVGGVAGYNSGTVSNCYNTGSVRGSGDFVFEVGGVVGANHGKVSNCYNTGEVSSSGDHISDVGGVVGNNRGTVSYCYNTGEVSNYDAIVGGVVGGNRGTASNCYNTGAVSGSTYVGGVVGYNLGTISNCYYDKSICQRGAINGSDDTDNNVIGLTTLQMIGTSSKLYDNLNNYEDNKKTVWLFKTNGDGIYYYPHLAGFNFDESGKQLPADEISADEWPNKGTFSATLSDNQFIYSGDTCMPDVKVTLDNAEETGYKVVYYDSSNRKIEEPKDAGTYRAYVYWEENAVSGLEMLFEILPASVTLTAISSDTDIYDGTEKTVSGLTCSVEGLTFKGVSANGKGTKTGVYDVTFSGVTVNVTKDTTGNYVVTGTTNGTLTINKKPLTITASSETKVYDGTALAKDSYTNSGLASGDTIESVTVTGTQTAVGTSDNVPSAAKIVNAAGENVTSCYDIKYVNGNITVKPASVTLTADSATKEFDGTALTKDSYTSSELASGDIIKSITITGTQTEVGTTDNVPSSAKIVNAAGEDVTGCYDINYVNGTLTVTKPAAPKLADDQKPAPKQDLKEDGKEQVLVLDPAKLPEGYTIEYSTDGGKTWKAAPTGTQSGEYTIEVKYTADGNHTDFFGDTLNVMIQGVYNQTESDGDWTKGSGKTYTFRIKKAFNDEVCFDNFTGVLVDGKQAQSGKDYTAVKGSTVITFAADYLETLSVGEHMIRVVFKDGEILLPLKILEAVATPTPAVDATPVTGDTANPFLLVALILMSMAGAAAVVMRRRKRA